MVIIFYDHAVHQRDPDRHAAEAAAEALDQDLAVVLEQVAAGQQRHRRAQHGRLVVGRGDEGHPHREADDDHAQDEDGVAEPGQERPVLDHQ